MSNTKKEHHSYETLLAKKFEALLEEAPQNPEARKLLHRLQQLTAEAKSFGRFPQHKVHPSPHLALELKLVLI